MPNGLAKKRGLRNERFKLTTAAAKPCLLSRCCKIVRAMEEKKTSEVVSELVANLEKKAADANSELSEIKSTMIVNFSGHRKENPKLLDGSEKTALQMFVKILSHYMDGA